MKHQWQRFLIMVLREWWNGIHSGLRSQRPKGIESSSLSLRTIKRIHRDAAKWEQFPETLVVLMQEELEDMNVI